MKHMTVIWLIIAAVLVIMGAVIFLVVMMSLNWDFSRLSTVKYETNSYFIDDGFENISINTNTADIVFLPSDDGTCRIVCHEEEKLKHTVSADDGTLTVSLTDSRKWYEYIGILWGTPKITVYLPNTEYGVLSIKDSTGDVYFENSDAAEISVNTSTGNVKGSLLSDKVFITETDTGRVKVPKTITGGRCEVVTDTGSIILSVK